MTNRWISNLIDQERDSVLSLHYSVVGIVTQIFYMVKKLRNDIDNCR